MPPAESFADAIKRLGPHRSDKEAWQTISAILWPLLFATSYRIQRGNRALAEDATQETLLRLLRYARFEEFSDNPDAFRSYALATCRNVNLNYIAFILHEREHTAEITSWTEPRASPTFDPELTAIRAELLETFILGLDAAERKLLDMLLQGYNIAEIATRLGLKYSNVAVRIHRLRNELSKSLNPK